MKDVILESVITCPRCGFAQRETMPLDACQFFYDCAVRLGALPAEAGGFVYLCVRCVAAPLIPATAKHDGGRTRFIKI